MSKVEPEQRRLPTHPGTPLQVGVLACLPMYVNVTGMYTRTGMNEKHTFMHKNAKTITRSWTLQICLIVERKASQRWENQSNGSSKTSSSSSGWFYRQLVWFLQCDKGKKDRDKIGTLRMRQANRNNKQMQCANQLYRHFKMNREILLCRGH